MASIQVHYTDDKSTLALYVDGALKKIGPQQEVLDTAIMLLGIKQVFDDDFMRGQDTYAGVAKTLDEIRAYKATVNAANVEAMRRKAAELLAEADNLEGKNL